MWWRRWAPELVIGAAAIASYLSALQGDFVSDALTAIPLNPALVRSRGWLVWFLRDFFWGSTLEDVTLYRPLTTLSFLLHIRTTGVAPGPFLFGNVLLHAGISVLGFWLGSRLVGRLAAFLAAMFFAVHPLHVEVVAWIMGRSELLSGLFALAACLGFLRATDLDEPRPWHFSVGAVLAYLAALFSKEHVALLPLWVALLWWLDRPNRAVKPALYVGLGSVAALALFLALRASALTRQPTVELTIGLFNPGAVVSTPLRWLTAAAVIWRYTLLFFWPARLSNDYSYAQTEASTGLGGAEAAGLLVILALLAGIVVAWRRAPGVALALAFAPITFFLVSNIPFPIGTVMAERLTYLPSLGLFWVVGWAVSRVPWPAALSRWVWQRDEETPEKTGQRGRVVAAAVAVVLLALFVRTVARNYDWRDNFALFTAALRVSPKSSVVLTGSAAMERVKGNVDRATELAQEAVRIYPKNFNALLLLGEIAMFRKDFDGAIDSYRKALAMGPRSAEVRSDLGIALKRNGRVVEAEHEFRAALRLSPRLFPARLALGGLLLDTKRPNEALHEFREAAHLSPRDPTPLYGMASAFLALGDREAAEANARRAAAAGFPVPDSFWQSLKAPKGTAK